MTDVDRNGPEAGQSGWARRWIGHPIPARLWGWARRHFHNLLALGGVLLAIGLALAVAALWAMSQLADSVLEGETLRFDEAILHGISDWTSPRRDILALDLTALGGGTVVLAVAVISATLLAVLGRRWYALLICAAVSGGWMLGPVLKILFDRPRPQVVEWRTPHAGHASFPSGHATMAMVLYVTLAYVVHRLGNRHWVSVVAWSVAALLVTVIGVTRLYLGVHYPSDVLAGYAVGFAWAMFCAAGAEILALRAGRGKDGEERVTGDEG